LECEYGVFELSEWTHLAFATNSLEDGKENEIVKKTPHTFKSYNIERIEIVVAKNLFFCDIETTREAL
jgi:hypothetical protein